MTAETKEKKVPRRSVLLALRDALEELEYYFGSTGPTVPASDEDSEIGEDQGEGAEEWEADYDDDVMGYTQVEDVELAVDNFISSLVTARIIKPSKTGHLPTFSEVFERFFGEEDEIVKTAQSFEDNIEGYMDWIGPDELHAAKQCFEEIRDKVVELLEERSNAH